MAPIKWEVCKEDNCELWWEEQVNRQGDGVNGGWWCGGCNRRVSVRREKLEPTGKGDN